VRKAFWVNLIVKYKTAAAPVNAFTEARGAEFTAAVDVAVNARL